MPPIGVGFGDVVRTAELAKEVISNIKSAPDDFKDAEQTVHTTCQLLTKVECDIESPTSIFRRDEAQAEHLRNLIRFCQRPLLRLSENLSKVQSLGSDHVKPLHRLRFSKRIATELRGEIALRNQELNDFLTSVGVGGVGRLETKMDNMQGAILEAIDKVAAETRLTRKGASYLSDHTNDDKMVWKQFRHDLIKSGFVSADIERHKASIYERLVELRENGLLDWDASTTDGSSECTVTYIAHERSRYRPPTASTVYTGSVNGGSTGTRSTIFEDDYPDYEPVGHTPSTEDWRMWTGSQANINLAGRIIRTTEERILIRTAKQEEVWISLANLTDDELSYVSTWQKREKKYNSGVALSVSDVNESDDERIPRQRDFGTSAAPEGSGPESYPALDHPDYDTEILSGQRATTKPSWRFRRHEVSQHQACMYKSGNIYNDALPRAASKGDTELVRRLLRGGYHIEAIGPKSYNEQYKDSEGKTRTRRIEFPETTALYRAADSSRFKTAHLLLRYGANPDTRGKDNVSLLRKLVPSADSDMIRLILEYGANVNAGGSLLKAAYMGRESTVKVLLDFGAAIGNRDGNGETPLYRASSQGHHRVAKLLLSEGAEHEALCRGGQSALYKAAGHGYERTVRALLRYGADPARGIGKTGESALFKAAHMGHQKTVELLLRRHANPNAENEFRKAYQVPQRMELVKQILWPSESRPDVGLLPLHAAAHIGHVGIARLLLAYGADVNARPKDGSRPAIYLAAEMGHQEMVKLLNDHGAQLLDQRYVDPVARFMSSDDQEAIQAFETNSDPMADEQKPWLAKLRKESLAEGGNGVRAMTKSWNRAKGDGTVSKLIVNGIVSMADPTRKSNVKTLLTNAVDTWATKP